MLRLKMLVDEYLAEEGRRHDWVVALSKILDKKEKKIQFQD